MSILSLRTLLAATALTFAHSAFGQSPPTEVVRAELLPGWRTESGTQMAALRLTLAAGWKTYWRAPGEAGIPPQFDWSGSENISGITFHWPRPEVFDLNGIRTIAYKHELVLPIEFQPQNSDYPVNVIARIELGVCEDICVPVTVEVSSELADATRADPAIERALEDGPVDGRAAGYAAPRCTAEPTRDGLRLTTALAFPDAKAGDFAVTELTGLPVWSAPVETSSGDGRLVQVTDLVPADARPFALNRSEVRTTVFTAAGEVIEFVGCAG
jgi:DsbC/DsbD-like thiol-disulfide interchange protein